MGLWVILTHRGYNMKLHFNTAQSQNKKHAEKCVNVSLSLSDYRRDRSTWIGSREISSLHLNNRLLILLHLLNILAPRVHVSVMYLKYNFSLPGPDFGIFWHSTAERCVCICVEDVTFRV